MLPLIDSPLLWGISEMVCQVEVGEAAGGKASWLGDKSQSSLTLSRMLVDSSTRKLTFFELCVTYTAKILWHVSIGHLLCFPGSASGKESTHQCRRHKRCGFNPWAGKIPWRRAWQSILGLFSGESHGQRSLEGCNPWGCKESDTTKAT